MSSMAMLALFMLQNPNKGPGILPPDIIECNTDHICHIDNIVYFAVSVLDQIRYNAGIH